MRMPAMKEEQTRRRKSGHELTRDPTMADDTGISTYRNTQPTDRETRRTQNLCRKILFSLIYFPDSHLSMFLVHVSVCLSVCMYVCLSASLSLSLSL